MATRSTVNREIRGFVVVWTGITLIIGIATFFGIYLTYDVSENSALNSGGVSLPIVTSPTSAEAAVVATSVSTATNAPTDVPPSATATDIAPTTETPPTDELAAETEEAVSVAQAVESEPEQEAPTATIEPTPLPVDNLDFQVAIQVQPSIGQNYEIQNVWMNDVQGMNIQWIKQQVRWDEVEVAPGEYDWARLDMAFDVASERGIKVLASVLTAPEWRRRAGVDMEEVGPPENYEDFGEFLTLLVERYQGQVHAIEVWNEQNIVREWTTNTRLSAADYVELLEVADAAIKSVDPGIIVISGALSPTGVSDGVNAIDDFDYMDQMINAGLLDHADCIGAHHNGYNIGPSITWDAVPNDPNAVFRGPFDNPHHSWSFRSTLQTYANKIQLAGGDQRLCVTEFGWPSVEDLEGYPPGFEFALDNTLQEQADFLVEALENMKEWDIVWIASIWNLNYGPQAGWDTQSDNTPYSLIGPEFSKRPAYDAIREWMAEHQSS